MIVEENKSLLNLGQKIGYLISYFLFTTILYFILLFLNKLPASWNYFHIILLTIAITLIGIIIQRLLR
jgi:hypothetical protein